MNINSVQGHFVNFSKCSHINLKSCLISLHRSPSVGQRGKRVCYHFFHETCARALQGGSHRECPLCRAPFQDIMPVPNIAEVRRAHVHVYFLVGTITPRIFLGNIWKWQLEETGYG